MTYGPDPDPYGAVPPYRIGYDTYTPNYPGIPGVANSFDPTTIMMPGGFPPPSFRGGSGDVTPTVPPGVNPTPMPAENFYYDRSVGYVQPNAPMPSAWPYKGTGPPDEFYTAMMAGAPAAASNVPVGFGQAYQGGNNGPRNVAGGLGRQTTLPLPIGTRPHSNGNAAQTPTASAAQNASKDRQNREEAYLAGSPTNATVGALSATARRNVPFPETNTRFPRYEGGNTRFWVGDDKSSAANFNGAWGSSGLPKPTANPARRNGPQFDGSDQVGKAEVMRNYLENLHGKDAEDLRADAMSRER